MPLNLSGLLWIQLCLAQELRKIDSQRAAGGMMAAKPCQITHPLDKHITKLLSECKPLMPCHLNHRVTDKMRHQSTRTQSLAHMATSRTPGRYHQVPLLRNSIHVLMDHAIPHNGQLKFFLVVLLSYQRHLHQSMKAIHQHSMPCSITDGTSR